MTEQLVILRADLEAEANDIRREVSRQQDRLGVLAMVCARIDRVIDETRAQAENPAAEGERRERRDIQGAALAILQEHDRLTAPNIRTYIERKMGPLSDSALARSLSALVGAGKVQEFGGVFSLPPAVRAVQDAAK